MLTLFMQEWRMGEASRIVQACVRQVPEELDASTQLFLLKRTEAGSDDVAGNPLQRLAYFPIHRRRTMVRQ